MESIYVKAHAAIRADPEHKPKQPKEVAKKRWNRKRISTAVRKNKVEQKKKSILQKLDAGTDE